MNKKDFENLNKNIEKDFETYIEPITDVDMLKELLSVYVQLCSDFNNSFDSFNSKMSSLSSLITVILGFCITIFLFIKQEKILNLSLTLHYIAIYIAILAIILLAICLVGVTWGQSFGDKYRTLKPDFPLKNALDLKTVYFKQTIEYYRHMIYNYYKTLIINKSLLEEKKTNLKNVFIYVLFCIILLVVALILIIL